MNEKNFNEIAKIMKDTNIGTLNNGWVCKQLADYFETTEHIVASVDGEPIIKKLFNREQFLKDCGVEQE